MEITVKEKYQELIGYISQMGYKAAIRYESQVEIFIVLSDYSKTEFMEVHLFQPLDNKNAYHFKKLRINWRILPDKYLIGDHWFDENTDQMIIFNILLFDILKWKVGKLSTLNIDASNIFIYEVINNWLKTREEQIRKEEQLKIANHLSIEEFRKVVGEELGKISINLKIGDK